jgi:hypothetical protein
VGDHTSSHPSWVALPIERKLALLKHLLLNGSGCAWPDT